MSKFSYFKIFSYIFVFIIFIWFKCWAYSDIYVDKKFKFQFDLLENDWEEVSPIGRQYCRFINKKAKSTILINIGRILKTQYKPIKEEAIRWLNRFEEKRDLEDLKKEAEGWIKIDGHDAYWMIYHFYRNDRRIKEKIIRVDFNQRFYQFRLVSRYNYFYEAVKVFDEWVGSVKFLRENTIEEIKEVPPLEVNKLAGWYDKQYALVVGIDKYKNTNIDRLQNAVNDALSVSKMFGKLGFKVNALYDEMATKSEILSYFSEILSKTDRNDCFLFYFAGHGQGFTLGNEERIGYILPYDANLNLIEKNIVLFDTEAIPINTIKKYSKNMKAKHVALLFDSCFSGLAMKRGLIITKNIDIEYYNDLLNRKAINILTAGDDQPVSDGTGHSPFTRAILEGLVNKGLDINDRDGYATFNQLAIYVKEKVEKATGRRQRPQFDNLSTEDGDFIFKLR
jgi:hypothetical protein